MAKKAMIEREKKRARLVNRYAAKRAELKEIAKNVRDNKNNGIVIFEHLSEDREEKELAGEGILMWSNACLLYTSPSPRDLSTSRMPSSA